MKIKKNPIFYHADDYFNRAVFKDTSPETFVNYVRRNTVRYTRIKDKIIFVERISFKVKESYHRHLLYCTAYEEDCCRFAKWYESILLFMQYDLVKMKKRLPSEEPEDTEDGELNTRMQQIIELLKIRAGANINYTLFMKEVGELKNYYYLNRKIWYQLLVGKITEMIHQSAPRKDLCKEALIAADMIMKWP